MRLDEIPSSEHLQEKEGDGGMSMGVATLRGVGTKQDTFLENEWMWPYMVYWKMNEEMH